VTAQPSPHLRFGRAIDARSLLLAELTAREMRHLTLEDALELVVLYAEVGDQKFEHAACRWLSRLTIERENLTLVEAQLAAVALGALREAPLTASTTLRSIASWVPG
jgi:hypothetical protein